MLKSPLIFVLQQVNLRVSIFFFFHVSVENKIPTASNLALLKYCFGKPNTV